MTVATGSKQHRTRAVGVMITLETLEQMEPDPSLGKGSVEAPFGTMTARAKRRRLPGGQGNDRGIPEWLRFMLLYERGTGETELRKTNRFSLIFFTEIRTKIVKNVDYV